MKSITATIAFILASSTAVANDHSVHHEYYDFARVIDVEPIYRTVEYKTSPRRCYEEKRYSRGSQKRNSNHSDNSAGTLVGGLIGGAIGNQFGSGKGRVAATVAGVAIGAAIGNDASQQSSNEYRYENEYRTRHVEHKSYQCQPAQTRISSELVGYEYSYRYRGNVYQGKSQAHPGDRIRLAINVTPMVN